MDASMALAVQLEALSMKVEGIFVAQQKTQVMQCDMCEGRHGTYECQVKTQAAYMRNAPHPQTNPYSNTYNLG